MLVARSVTKSFGGQLVLQDVSLTIGPRSRIGLVGPNGIGKSTLLRILAGLEEADSGAVERNPSSITVGWLPQEVNAPPGETLRSYLARRTGVAAAEEELDRLTAAMADDHSPAGEARPQASIIDAYTEALDHYLALGGDDLPARAAEVCAEVELPPDRLDVEVAALSGGQQARAALAAILLSRYDVFLLDEPTNNLDFDGLSRLESFLDGLAGGVLVVSHDRAFLDRAVTRVVELQEESHRAVEYAGGWSEYVERRELARAQQYEAYETYRAERSRLTERMGEQKQWAVSGASKEKKKKETQRERQAVDFRVNRTEKLAGKVKITEKQLERLEARAVDKPWEGWQLHLQLGASAPRSGAVVARLERAVVHRGTFTLGPVDLEVGWAERVALLGANGSGKTTLLRTLLGDLPLDAGTRYLGPGVKVGELDQSRGLFATDEPVLAAFQRESGLAHVAEARSLLAKFGLGATHVDRPGGRLSPGERTRALLATLMATGVNCLVLDEPTNHLDLAAIEELERALASYEGTLLLVTHDRRFLDAVHVDRVVGVDQGRVTEDR